MLRQQRLQASVSQIQLCLLEWTELQLNRRAKLLVTLLADLSERLGHGSESPSKPGHDSRHDFERARRRGLVATRKGIDSDVYPSDFERISRVRICSSRLGRCAIGLSGNPE